ncbi:hypothetical protein FH5_03735 [Priestia endophytica]|nr:hypothetical protein FH5_03735 [Priestia endophytica]
MCGGDYGIPCSSIPFYLSWWYAITNGFVKLKSDTKKEQVHYN